MPSKSLQGKRLLNSENQLIPESKYVYFMTVASNGEAGSPSILYRLAPSGLSAHAYLT